MAEMRGFLLIDKELSYYGGERNIVVAIITHDIIAHHNFWYRIAYIFIKLYIWHLMSSITL